MNIIFQINGGIGKCIMATAVCASIKIKYPECQLIVISGYPDVFLGNKNVDRAFTFGYHPYFFKEYVENKEFLFLGHDPYLETKHLNREEHLIETWCKMFDLPVSSLKGELFLNQREIDFYSNKYSSDKPIFLLQTNGGAENDIKYSWARDMPSHIAKAVITEFSEQYNIVHIKRDDQPDYANTNPISDNARALFVLVMLSQKSLLIDSFAQHAAAALDKSSTVLWICNSPKVFGYEGHTNIVSNEETVIPELRNAFLSKYNISGEPVEFPYNNETEMFNLPKIIESLKK